MITIQELIIDLHPKEVALLLALRHKFPFGDVTIKMKDGVPMRISKAYEFDDLTPPSI